eukprot:9247326-Prorocentrum_lima.AAC.1
MCIRDSCCFSGLVGSEDGVVGDACPLVVDDRVSVGVKWRGDNVESTFVVVVPPGVPWALDWPCPP